MREVHSETYRGCSIRLVTDEDPPNPREFTDLGRMICSHRYYNLGDDQKENVDIESVTQNALVLPVYMYDHSGITLSTKPFSCTWDSGQVGIIYCRLEAALNAFKMPEGSNWQSICPGHENEALDLSQVVGRALEEEVRIYDDYLNSNVVGYITTSLGEEEQDIESVWGFYPDHRVASVHQWDYPISEARQSIDAWIERERESAIDMCTNI
jgi:hypothetical protein